MALRSFSDLKRRSMRPLNISLGTKSDVDVFGYLFNHSVSSLFLFCFFLFCFVFPFLRVSASFFLDLNLILESKLIIMIVVMSIVV